jgi:aminoglycoside 3-N-acetyltransferase
MKKISKQTLIVDLKKAGIEKGDRIFVHSSFKKIGLTSGGPEVVVDALKTLISPTGTIGMPLFMDKFSPDEPFDPATSPSGVGIIAEVFRKSDGVKRSYSPSHSVGCWGRDAEAIVCGGTFRPPYSLEGPFGKLYDLNFKIVMLGCGLAPNSTIHAVEDWAELPYCRDGVTTCYTRLDPDKTGREYDHMPCGHRDFYRSGEASLESKYVKLLMRHGKLYNGQVGAATLYWMYARDLVDIGMAELDEDPDLFLCDDPKCSGCVNNKINLSSWQAWGGARWDWVRMGRTKVDITPAVDGWINQGWCGPGMAGEGIYDPLYARVLVFRKKWEKTAIVSMDICQMPREVADRIKERIALRSYIPASNVALCCTHTHTGPAVGNKLIWEEKDISDRSYIEELTKKVSGAVYMAAKEAIPVTVGFDRRVVDIGGINRRVRLKNGTYMDWNWPPHAGCPLPNGKPARDFSVLVFKNSKGEVVAGIGHYACHPIFSPYICRKVTADYPGIFSNAVEQSLGNGAVICFLQGASGDQMPLKPGSSYDLAVQAGQKLAFKFMGLAQQQAKGEPLKKIQCKLIEHRLKHSAKRIVTPLQVICLNDVVIGFIGAEPFLELDDRFRRQVKSPRLLLVGLANDEIGYVFLRETFRHPTYEVSGCRHWSGGKPGMGEELIATCARLANSLCYQIREKKGKVKHQILKTL